LIRYINEKGIERLITERDTIYTNIVSKDTIFSVDSIISPIEITKEKLILRVERIPDTRYIRVSGECKPDTIIVEKKVIEFDASVKKNFLETTTLKQVTNGLTLFLVIAIIGISVYLFFRFLA
jgi:hypothetical protein